MVKKSLAALLIGFASGAPSGGAATAATAAMVATVAMAATVAMPATAAAGDARDSAADSPVLPFAAQFQAEWKGIGVAVSDLDLRRAPDAHEYLYTWRVSARGIFRLVYSDDVLQTSWFSISGGHVRTRRYEASEGNTSVKLDFDWAGGHARGTSEGKPLDLKLQEGTQDVLSIQIEVMQDLKNDSLPSHFQIIDKDEVKDFLYTREGTARIHTALGWLDTVVVTSQRSGGNRVLRMWFAPALGYTPVQAERSRDGKLEFAMKIKTLRR